MTPQQMQARRRVLLKRRARRHLLALGVDPRTMNDAGLLALGRALAVLAGLRRRPAR